MTGAATKAAAAATAVPNAPLSDSAGAGNVAAVEEHRSSSSSGDGRGGGGCICGDLTLPAAHPQKVIVEAREERQQPLEEGAAPGTSPAAAAVGIDGNTASGACDDSVDSSGGGGRAETGEGGTPTDRGRHTNGVSKMTTHPPARPPPVPASAIATKPRLAEWVKAEGQDDDSDVDTANSLRGGSGGSAPSSAGSELSCATTPAAAAAAAAAARVFPAGAGATPPEAKGPEDVRSERGTPAKGGGERVSTEAGVGGGPEGGGVEAEASGGGGTATAAAAPAPAPVAARKLADWIKDGGVDDSEAETSTSG
ncbi:unnamed protein product [Ectocarpus sp. 13 AM-2016]